MIWLRRLSRLGDGDGYPMTAPVVRQMASLGFNASVTGVAPDGTARLWRATGAPFWRTDRAGALVLP